MLCFINLFFWVSFGVERPILCRSVSFVESLFICILYSECSLFLGNESKVQELKKKEDLSVRGRNEHREEESGTSSER